MSVSVSINDDYACVNFKGGAFYYGYEVSKCKCGNVQVGGGECTKCGHDDLDWCFQAKIKDKVITFPVSELDVQFSCAEALLAGIGKYMEETA